MAVVVIDNIVCIIIFVRPLLSVFARPVVFGSFLHQVRLNFKNFYCDLKDTGVTIFALFFFIAWFAGMGIYLFRYSLEGYSMFDTFSNANFNLIILVTTANFPDVMLPAYERNYWSMLYFIIFICIGIYFMMNFLLANVFNNFKDRLEIQAQTILIKTEMHLEEFFDNFDYHKKGFLNLAERKEFFCALFDMNLKRKRHSSIFNELVKAMGCQDSECMEKERVLDFFMQEDGYLKYQ